MVLLAYCHPCKRGDHKHHYEAIQTVSPGMMGGVKCQCKGECKDFQPEPPLFDLSPVPNQEGERE